MEAATLPPTVVLAERNRHIRDLLRREFERAGFAVRACGLGREAATLALDGADVLVLDQETPDADLAGVIRRVLARRPGLPVVVRAHSVEEAEDCLVGDGVVFVPKDQDPARLLRAVDNALGGAAMRASRAKDTLSRAETPREGQFAAGEEVKG